MFYPKRQVEPDADNLLKVLNDAMKRAGLIVDDAATWLIPYLPKLLRSDDEPYTEFTIGDELLGPPLDPRDDPDLKRLLKRKRRG